MPGTRALTTRAMERIPPRVTAPVAKAMPIPVHTKGMPKEVCSAWATELDCTVFPIPKLAQTVSTANSTASHFCFRPLSRKYIGPPAISPFSSVIRYLTESRASPNLVAIPTSPVIHIQKSAPGPPEAMAVATPAMLPVPTVAARAVIKAWK